MRTAASSQSAARCFFSCTQPPRLRSPRTLEIAAASARALLVVGFVMEAGAILFSAELAMHVFTGERIFPFAAPIGGTTMILSWLALAVVFAAASRREA